MRAYSARRLVFSVTFALIVWVTIAAACACVGSTGFGTGQFVSRLNDYVLPASLVGAALAAAGVAYQAILRNPLSDPYLLGVSSGASLAAYAWRLPAFGLTTMFGAALSQQACAFAGALAAVAIVLGMAGRRGRIDPVTAVLVGVIVSSICGSVYLLLNSIYLDLPGTGGGLTFFVGNVQTNLSPGQFAVAGGVIGVCWISLLALAGPLSVGRLSDDEAASLGVRVHRVRWAGLVVASLMTAAAVAISGPIGFVGLICPHVARLLFGSDPRRTLPLATGLGAGLLAGADALSRYLSGAGLNTLLPVGVITGLLGGPFFLVLLGRMRREKAGAT